MADVAECAGQASALWVLGEAVVAGIHSGLREQAAEEEDGWAELAGM